ncbi:MAG: acyltransferase [Lachnospiraceae bacterium]|nr:acyltransferase [Lachnospiraceae bacterium]
MKIIELVSNPGEKTNINPKDSNKINSFNFFRVCFAAFVIFSHSFELIGLEAPKVFNRSLGNFAVHCFFVMSGYFIMHSWNNSQNGIEYLLKRFLRIIPEFIVGILLSEILAALCQNYIICPTPYIKNGVVWTLYYEILLYVVILVIGTLKLNNEVIVGSTYLISFILIIVFQTNTSAEYSVVAPLLFLFLGGGYICSIEKKINMEMCGIVSIFLLLIENYTPDLFVFIIKRLPLIYGPNLEEINYYVYLICLPFALIYIGKYFVIKIYLRIDLSYGLYMYAWPIQQSIIYLFIINGMNLEPKIIFVLSGLGTLLVSIAGYILIEKPMITIRYKILNLFRKYY